MQIINVQRKDEHDHKNENEDKDTVVTHGKAGVGTGARQRVRSRAQSRGALATGTGAGTGAGTGKGAFKDSNGNSYLMLAAKYSNFKVLSLILKNKLYDDINDKNFFGDSPLLLCAMSNKRFDTEYQSECDNFDCFTKLLNVNGINIHQNNKQGIDAFAACLNKNKVQFVNYMLKNSGSNNVSWKIDNRKINSSDVINTAARASNVDMLDKAIKTYLAKSKSKSEALNEICKTMEGYDDQNPFKCANYQCFRLLLDTNDVIVTVTDDQGLSPFTNCLLNNKYDFAEELIDKCKNCTLRINQVSNRDEKLSKILNSVARDARLKLMKQILKTSLKFDDARKVSEAVITLVTNEKRCDSDYDNNNDYHSVYVSAPVYDSDYDSDYDNYAFHVAKKSENFQCFELLLEQKKTIDINFKKSNGDTILGSCIKHNKVEYVKHLVKNFKVKSSSDKQSPFQSQSQSQDYYERYNHNSATTKSETSLREIYSSYSQIDCQDTNYLLLAAQESNYEILLEIVKHGLYDKTSKNGGKYISCIDLALFAIARSDKNLNVNNMNNNYINKENETRISGVNRYQQADDDHDDDLECDNFRCFKLIMERGGDINIVNEIGDTVFAMLIQKNKTQHAKFILQQLKRLTDNNNQEKKMVEHDEHQQNDQQDEDCKDGKEDGKNGNNDENGNSDPDSNSLAIFQDFVSNLKNDSDVIAIFNRIASIQRHNIMEHGDDSSIAGTADTGGSASTPRFNDISSLLKKIGAGQGGMTSTHEINNSSTKPSEKRNGTRRGRENELENNVDKFKKYQDSTGNNYLMIAAQYSNFQILSKILEFGYFDDINKKNKDGNSALLLAVKSTRNFDIENQRNNDNYRCFEKLMKQQNIDVTIKNKKGETAKTWCKQKGKQKYFQYIQSTQNVHALLSQ